MGLIIVRCAFFSEDRPALEFALAACALAPLADLLLARQHSGDVPQLAIHASGVLGIAAVWGLLRGGF